MPTTAVSWTGKTSRIDEQNSRFFPSIIEIGIVPVVRTATAEGAIKPSKRFIAAAFARPRSR